MQFGIERDGIDLGGRDGEDVGDLVAWLTFVFEDVLRDVEEGHTAQCDAELLDELSAQGGFRGFAELDTGPRSRGGRPRSSRCPNCVRALLGC